MSRRYLLDLHAQALAADTDREEARSAPITGDWRYVGGEWTEADRVPADADLPDIEEGR